MRVPKVVLVDGDERYLASLELKFLEQFGDDIELHVITEREFLERFFSQPQQVDILLIHEEWYISSIGRQGIGNIILLSETQSNPAEQETYYKIYKYSSSLRIFNEIIEQSKLKVDDENYEVHTVMMYSPIGGIGKTTVAMALAETLARQHKRVLYMNVEMLQNFQSMLEERKFSASKFDLLMTQRRHDIMKYFRDAVGKENFEYILPFKQPLSTLNITVEDYMFLIERIKDSKQYEYIIIDASLEFTADKARLMAFCDHIVIIGGQDEVSAVKLGVLLDNLDCENNAKYSVVSNFYQESDRDYLEGNGIVCEYIPRINCLMDERVYKALASLESLQRLAYKFM